MNSDSVDVPQEKYEQKKITILRRLKGWLARTWEKSLPGPEARRGATAGILGIMLVIAFFFGLFFKPGLPWLLDDLFGVVYLVVMAALLWLLFSLLFRFILVVPRFLTTAGFMALLVLIFSLSDIGFPEPFNIILGLIFGIAGALLGAGLARLFRREFRFSRPWKKIYVVLSVLLPLAFLVYCVVWLADRGSTDHLVEFVETSHQVPALQAENPARPGNYAVKSLTYGSGENKRRPEFGADADLITKTVDATPFIKNNKGWKMKLRNWYWGFGFKEFPVNGTVWYPEGEGPFPLVLVVHGNHRMQEFSDPGYAYLGEHLASRGFILVSVDENFFNGAFQSGLRSENDGRGWMLLQHLSLWREWNQTEGHVFHQKVDMENLGLIGHSRGGEAAAIAGAFNRLKLYPDDANTTFDFNFNLKAIISIAPSDGQYRPSGRPTPLENVNYFVIQGAHDADVSTFAGDRQFNRVRFTDDEYWFKASLYSYRSNHGQFNTVWGDSDWGKPMGLILNRKALLSGEEQRTIARVYFTAFLEVILHGDTSYMPMFRDFRVAADWLPQDIYINRFSDSTFQTVCDYEEDVDLTSGTLSGTVITSENLGVWKEADLKTRYSRSTKQEQVVHIGWRALEEEDRETSEAAEHASPVYSVQLPENAGSILGLSSDSILVFDLTDADEKIPDPDEGEEDADKGGAENAESEDKNRNPGEREDQSDNRDEEDIEDTKPLEITLELVTEEGVSVRLPLSQFRPVPPVTKSRFSKIPNEADSYGQAYEPTLQTFELPLQAFAAENPDFEPSRLKTIRFIFCQEREGVVIMDNLGFSAARR
jgi:dienelactone hydrolase